MFQGKVFIVFVFFALFSANAAGNTHLSFMGVVNDSTANEGLMQATIRVYENSPEQRFVSGTITDADGSFKLNLPMNRYLVSVSYIGYRTVWMNVDLQNAQPSPMKIQMVQDTQSLNEVIVTATESKGQLTSSSVIDQKAMQHLQPTSFTDLLSLLPGGSSSTPNMTVANTIALREVGTSDSDYNTSSLGTSFIVDGTVLNNDANLQQIRQGGSTQDASRSVVSSGVDMRTISTDNIERVEIIRGIPSAAYGDVTSGVVIIERKLVETPWQARFKADQYGKLLSAGKGVAFKNTGWVLNADIDYTDSKADPRNLMETYKRINASIRTGKKHEWADYKLNWKMNFDFRTSMDDEKNDPEILTMTEDAYKSTFSQYAHSQRLTLDFPEKLFTKQIYLNASLSYSTDKIEQSRFIQLDRDRVVPDYMNAGEMYGTFLPYKYVAELTVDGKPLNAAISAKYQGEGKTGAVKHKVHAGLNYSYSKNFGEGQVYDLSRPLNTLNATRPRAYHTIPALQEMALFVEDQAQVSIGKNTLKLNVGLRMSTLPGLNDKHKLAGKVFFDPRVNVEWIFPKIDIAEEDLNISLSAGMGSLTKKPTLNYLYPDTYYMDLVQLNYWHPVAENKTIHLRTYTIDPTNYELNVARNNKWEVRLRANYDGYNFSATYFRENMTSGFRYETMVNPYEYKRYDKSGIDGDLLTGQVDVSTLPFAQDTILGYHSMATNGSSIQKEGLEFQLATKRWDIIKTRLTVYGAYFKTTYTNSEGQFDTNVNKVIGNTTISDKYVGFYDWTNGATYRDFNTNFLFDTHIEKLKLTFSTTFECKWFYSRESIVKNGTPTHYMDVSGQLKPYTQADKTDIYKQWLDQKFSPTQFQKRTEPFYCYINLKVTKNIGKYLRTSLFVNRILNILPDYENEMGTYIRRSTSPYFGMELNLII